MKKTAVLFDLDGTLLPMDQDIFVKEYFGRLCRKLAPYGYQSDQLVKALWKSTGDMIANMTDRTNEEVFWDSFCSILGDHVKEDMPLFQEFYLNEFKEVRISCGYTPEARDIVEFCRENHLRTILATNPIFPHEATFERIQWAGLDNDLFEYITTYENSTSTKPNTRYYEELLEKLNLKPEECIMVGNDAEEDGAASIAGIDLFLLDGCLINSHGKDLSDIPHGNFGDLKDFIRKHV